MISAVKNVSFKGIQEDIKGTSVVKQSEADTVRIANILTKTEKGESPVFDVLEFFADKVDDKKRNAIIGICAFVTSALAYKTIGAKVVPYAKEAVKWCINLLPEATSKKMTQKISNFINKELKDVKFVNKASTTLSKFGVNKVGDVALWSGAGLAAAYTSKGANFVGDEIDDKKDLKTLKSDN